MTDRRLQTPSDLSVVMGLTLSDEQLAAATAPLGPSVVVAGAGSGKTTVMAARVVWLVGTGQVRPGQVLGLTFTRRAAGELSARIDEALSTLGEGGDDGPQVYTYDAFVQQLLGAQGARLGIQMARLMTGAEPYEFADLAAGDPGFEPFYLRQVSPGRIADGLLRLDREMSAHTVTPEAVALASGEFASACALAPGHAGGVYKAVAEASQAALGRSELTDFVQRYRDLKAASAVAEFGDLQEAATRLATTVPAVGVALRDLFKVVLLDEYQDTSSAQAAMLAALFSGPDVGRGRGHPVCAVGDPRQAIYGWRGAAADNMGGFFRLFPRPDASPPPSFPLSVNRRSGSSIVDAANLVAQALPGQPLRSDAALGQGRIEVSSHPSWPEEVAAVASRLVTAHRLGETTRWSDMAVLLRRNRDIPAFYKALSDRGAPAEIVGLSGLLALPEVAALVAALRLALDDGDNAAVALLASGPVVGLGPRDMAALARRAAQLAGPAASSGPRLLDAVFDPGPQIRGAARDRLARLGDRIRAVRRQRHQPAVELVQIAAEQLGLTAELDVPSPWAAAAGLQVRRFMAQVADHSSSTGRGSLRAILRWLDDEAKHGEQLDQATPSQDDSIKLLSVHKAKGLEWDVVALPALCQGVFPNDIVSANPLTHDSVLPFELRLDAEALPALSEVSIDAFRQFETDLKADQSRSEDRLSYVAVSRARRLLLASASHWRQGLVKPRQPSRLFQALAQEASGTGSVCLCEPPGDVNPLDLTARCAPWPVALDAEQQTRLDAVAALVNAGTGAIGPSLDADATARVAVWRAHANRLIESARTRVGAPMPVSVSASSLLLAGRDSAAFAADLARPMPRLVDPAATRGSLFHRWIERRFAVFTSLDDIDRDDPVLGRDDMDAIADLVAAFEAGPYAGRVPLGVEVPFIAVIAGQQVRGRIDAVYAGEAPDHYHIVDWKTSAGLTADPLQLELYRHAWAQATGTAPDQVDAVFYYVGQDRVVRPALMDLADLEAWVRRLRDGSTIGGVA